MHTRKFNSNYFTIQLHICHLFFGPAFSGTHGMWYLRPSKCLVRKHHTLNLKSYQKKGTNWKLRYNFRSMFISVNFMLEATTKVFQGIWLKEMHAFVLGYFFNVNVYIFQSQFIMKKESSEKLKLLQSIII